MSLIVVSNPCCRLQPSATEQELLQRSNVKWYDSVSPRIMGVLLAELNQ